ncbi:hypothetical protein H4684_002277 [Desulfomicrobium macestii]|uniref:Uncharacterized protein n=1 Tax=Desulfomicrobium macestii TaxID=90731 RepID=A0ABR9H4H8_9BACT|nr:hypothetical protein [Desulfomicrobium macestii]MBE1425620.1 hypothetical protein [Desulfomicrobium macestii]
MNTTDMINHIRANKQPLSQRVLQAIADRLEEQDAYLRSALGTLSTQEEQLRGLGSELAESERHRQILTTQNKELLDARKNLEALEAALAPLLAWDNAERRTSIIMGPAEPMLESLGCTVVAEDFDRIREILSHYRDAHAVECRQA